MKDREEFEKDQDDLLTVEELDNKTQKSKQELTLLVLSCLA